MSKMYLIMALHLVHRFLSMTHHTSSAQVLAMTVMESECDTSSFVWGPCSNCSLFIYFISRPLDTADVRHLVDEIDTEG